MKKIDLIIPCYNEEDNIPSLIAEVSKYTNNLSYSFGFMFIDDGSNDNTYDTVCSLSKKARNISIIKFSKNFGKESAIVAALNFCEADAAIIIDADLQHPPTLIPALIAEWENGADIVDAVKKERQKGYILNTMMSVSFNWLMTILTDMDFANASDYKLLDRKAINILNSMSEKTRFFRGLTNWIGFNHSKIEFNVESRRRGQSKWNRFKLFQLSLDAITSYSSKPLHIVTILGICTFGFSFILGVQTLYNKFFGHAVTGFTTVILIILLSSSIIMISIGILGLYLSKIFKEVKNRPIFVIDKRAMSQNSDHETLNP